jgi:CRISPR/Cas system-associated exonuclease Cas4 (RecB family)
MGTILTGLLVLLTGGLLFAWSRRAPAQALAEIPIGYTVLSADLGYDRTLGAQGPILLRDDATGVVGKADLLLDGPAGLVPVEYQRAWASCQPGKARPSHILQLATVMLLCEADPRVDRRPVEGWLRYLGTDGRVVKGGEVQVPNTTDLRQRVQSLITQIRQASATGEEQHRDHQVAAKCQRCALRAQCGEAL